MAVVGGQRGDHDDLDQRAADEALDALVDLWLSAERNVAARETGTTMGLTDREGVVE